MSHPDEELLADLALGDDLEVSPEARDHVSGCPVCQSTVQDLRGALALAAHAESPPTWSRPPQQVWSRIEDAIAAQPPAASGSGSPEPAAVTTLGSRRAARPRRVLPWAAGMAAAGLAIGLLSGRGRRLPPSRARACGRWRSACAGCRRSTGWWCSSRTCRG